MGVRQGNFLCLPRGNMQGVENSPSTLEQGRVAVISCDSIVLTIGVGLAWAVVMPRDTPALASGPAEMALLSAKLVVRSAKVYHLDDLQITSNSLGL